MVLFTFCFVVQLGIFCSDVAAVNKRTTRAASVLAAHRVTKTTMDGDETVKKEAEALKEVINV